MRQPSTDLRFGGIWIHECNADTQLLLLTPDHLEIVQQLVQNSGIFLARYLLVNVVRYRKFLQISVIFLARDFFDPELAGLRFGVSV